LECDSGGRCTVGFERGIKGSAATAFLRGFRMGLALPNSGCVGGFSCGSCLPASGAFCGGVDCILALMLARGCLWDEDDDAEDVVPPTDVSARLRSETMIDVLVLVLVRAAGETSRFGVRTWRASKAASQINLIITRVQCTGKHTKQHDALSRAKITQRDEKLKR
jgi:hypothetical protein